MSQATRARAGGALLWAALLTAWANPAAGQPEPLRARGTHRLGPARVTPVISIPYLGVDTNVFNRPFQEVPDVSGVLSGSLGAQLALRRRVLLDGNGQVSINYFRRQGTEQFTNYGGGLGVSTRVSRLSLAADVASREGRDRFDIEIDERLRRRERRANVAGRLALTRKLSALVRGSAYRQELLEGSLATRQALNREEVSGLAELGYALTPRTSLAASSSLIEDRFFGVGVLGVRRARSSRHLLGMDFSEKAALKGFFRAGVRSVPAISEAAGRQFTTLAAAGRLLLPLQAARLELSGERDFFYSGEAPTGVEAARSGYVLQRVRLDITRELPFDLIGVVAIERGRSRHLLPGIHDGVYVRRGDNQSMLSASVLARLGDRLKAGATIGWTRRRSNAPLASYEGMRYGVTAEWRP